MTAEIEGLEGDTAHLEFLGGRVLGGLVLLETLVLEHVHEGGLAWGGRGRGRGGRGGDSGRVMQKEDRLFHREEPLGASICHMA